MFLRAFAKASFAECDSTHITAPLWVLLVSRAGSNEAKNAHIVIIFFESKSALSFGTLFFDDLFNVARNVPILL